MARPHGKSPHNVELVRALEAAPYAFNFYQALRRLECAHPDKPRLGQSVRPIDDPVRLGQEPSMAFAPSTLSSFTLDKDGGPPRLCAHFFGLFGPNGPLPLHLTEYASERSRHADDPTFVRFADIFHHRLMSFFYRAWANTQPTVSFERPRTDGFAVYLGALFGVGMDSLRNRDAAPDHAKLNYTGHLACQTRHPDGLRALLHDFFELPVSIGELVGEWMVLPQDGRWRLGASRQTGSLGSNVIVGARIWGSQHKFRVVAGPMSHGDYTRLLPGGESLRRITAFVRNYIGDELAWDLRLILKRDDVPKLELGKTGQLGWTTWLGARRTDTDADDLIIDPFAQVA
jgi:type VI secretion system protein ImpH